MPTLDRLRLRQLDASLLQAKGLRARPTPSEGWVRTIREALGMSLQQLASRTGLSKNAVASVERNEAKRTVRLESLARLANAMGCDLVYAIVPRDSLEQLVETQAKGVARSLVGRVADSMDLEQQGTSSAEKEHLIQEIAARILDDGRLWDV